MRFLTDYSEVYFTFLDKPISVYSTFVEFTIPYFNIDVSIKFYGLIIAFGFLLAVLFGGRLAYKWKIDLNKMLDVLLFGTIGGIIGARLYYVIFEWDYYSQHLSEIPQIWNGGLAIYGGLIGAVLVGYFVCKKVDINFLKLLDMCSMSFLIGQGIGRWGNFANQEAFGTNTDMPWGMFSNKISSYMIENYAFFEEKGISVDPSMPVHPTFLYESLWCIIGFFIIYYICRRHYKFAGQLILWYGVVYGCERAIVEGFRTDSLYIPNTSIRISQILSAVIAVLCAAILISKYFELKKNPVSFSPVEVLPPEKDYDAGQSDEEKTEEINRRRLVKKTQKEKIKAKESDKKGDNDG